MRLVFFGSGEFAIPALREVAKDVVLVVTQPDRPAGRGMSLRSSPVHRAARDLGLEVNTPEKARSSEFVARIRRIEPDALIVASYGQILSEALLQNAMRGGINLHGSILPKYRGAAPIQRAILNGESETGVTLMQMDKGMDTGDVIDVVRTPIGPKETYGELQGRLGVFAARLLEKWLSRIAAGDYPRIPQNHDEATVAPKISKQEAELRFERPASDEFNRYRAFTPNPGPFLKLQSENLRLHKLELRPEVGAPGTVLATKPFPLIAFAGGSLEFLEVQPEGKKIMSGKDWANGLRLRLGEALIGAESLKHG